MKYRKSKFDKKMIRMLKKIMEDPDVELTFFSGLDLTIPPVDQFIQNNKLHVKRRKLGRKKEMYEMVHK